MNGYGRVRGALIEEYKDEKLDIPSYYIYMKERPNVEEYNLVPSNAIYEGIIIDSYNIMGYEDRFQAYLDVNADERDVEVRNTNVMSVKIVCDYTDYLVYILAKKKEQKVDFGDNIIFLIVTMVLSM